MADREIIHTSSDGGSGGMVAILGLVLGVLLVGGLIFFFAVTPTSLTKPGWTALAVALVRLPPAVHSALYPCATRLTVSSGS